MKSRQKGSHGFQNCRFNAISWVDIRGKLPYSINGCFKSYAGNLLNIYKSKIKNEYFRLQNSYGYENWDLSPISWVYTRGKVS